MMMDVGNLAERVDLWTWDGTGGLKDRMEEKAADASYYESRECDVTY